MICAPVPAQLLPSLCPALLYSAQLCSALLLPCSYPAPSLLLHCSRFCPALALLLLCSCPAPVNRSLVPFIIISTLRLFSARREPTFMVIDYGSFIEMYKASFQESCSRTELCYICILRERALRALTGNTTLTLVSLSAFRWILFWKKCTSEKKELILKTLKKTWKNRIFTSNTWRNNTGL